MMNIQLGTLIGAALLSTSVALSGMQGAAPGQIVEPAQLQAQAQARQKRERRQEQERQREVEQKRQKQRPSKQKSLAD